MSGKILFIDDDRLLLNTMERNLGFDFDVEIAEGGEQGLEVIERSGPFAVVVVDMQMPKMNGLQTIAAAREKMPNAVFLMLTGNQDQGTAINAVNEGQVFRFLNKPCQVTEIKAAIEAALRQHELLTAEKELLYGTFSGAINLMTDIIEMRGDLQFDSGRMAETIGQLAEHLSVEIGWEEKVASRVLLVGVSMLGHNEISQLETLDPTSTEHKALFAHICELSAKMIEKIPRLEGIAELLRALPETKSYGPTAERDEVMATLLNVVFYWNFLTCRGLSAAESELTICKIMPDLNQKVLEGITFLQDNQDEHELIEVKVSELCEGMVAQENIDSENGDRLVTGGRRLTIPMIDNLRRTPEYANTKIWVVANSCPQLAS